MNILFMEVLCLEGDREVTKLKRYNLIEEGRIPFIKKFWVNGYLIENDLGIIKWYEPNPLQGASFILLTGECVQYIGPVSKGLTIGSYYELFDRDSSEYL